MKNNTPKTALDLGFRVDTSALLEEIVNCAIDRRNGILKTPINIFKKCLVLLTQRCIEINDPLLNVRCLCLGLYEVHANDIQDAIDNQLKLASKTEKLKSKRLKSYIKVHLNYYKLTWK